MKILEMLRLSVKRHIFLFVVLMLMPCQRVWAGYWVFNSQAQPAGYAGYMLNSLHDPEYDRAYNVGPYPDGDTITESYSYTLTWNPTGVNDPPPNGVAISQVTTD